MGYILTNMNHKEKQPRRPVVLLLNHTHHQQRACWKALFSGIANKAKAHAISTRRETVIPPTLLSPAASRGPLLQAFIHGFFPSQDWTCPILADGLNQWAVAKCPSMQLVSDAVGLMQLGVASRDQRSLTEGQRRQVPAVQSLRSELCRPGVSFQNVSCTAVNMMISGLFSATSSGASGCDSHIYGLTAILQAHSRQPDVEPLAPLLLKHYHRLILMHALINRKSISISDRILGADEEGKPGSVEALIRLCSRLPSLMEATSPQFGEVIERDMHHLQVMASTLAGDLDGWLQSYEQSGFRYRRSPLEFLSFVDADILGLYWSSRLLLAESRYQLQKVQLSGRTDEPDAVQSYKDEADMYAIYLFDAATAMDKYEGSTLSKAFAMRAPLYFASQWWTLSADRARLQSTLEFKSRLQSELSQIDWDTLLYWSFLPIMWLV